MMEKISVIIPAFNEVLRIEHTLFTLYEYFKDQIWQVEIILVDDGSTDDTVSVVGKFINKIVCTEKIQIITIRNKINKGKGWVVREGILASKGDVVLYMDADGSTDVRSLEGLMEKIKEGYDIALGSRRILGNQIISEQPWYRLFLGWIFRMITRFLLGLKIIDTQNGFKLLKGDFARKLATRLTIKGWAFDVELLILAKKMGGKYVEVPVIWKNDERSKVKFRGMVRMFFDIFNIYFRYHFDRL